MDARNKLIYFFAFLTFFAMDPWPWLVRAREGPVAQNCPKKTDAMSRFTPVAVLHHSTPLVQILTSPREQL